MNKVPNLSKSRFQAGLQCHKRLWLECYRREVADPLDAARLALFRQGTKFGEVARDLYPGGTLVAEGHLQAAAACQTTDRLVADGVACLYEAALAHEGVLVRVDILAKGATGGWRLVEVKSSGQLKPEHVTDAAIQTYVSRGAGLQVDEVHLVHLRRGCVLPDCLASDDPQALADVFGTEDITAQVQDYLPGIPGLLSEMKAMLGAECPAIEVGDHCSRPYDCFFKGHCDRVAAG